MSRRAEATQREIERAIKAVQNSGLDVGGVEVDGTKIIVLTTGAGPQQSKQTTEDLDRELAEFEAHHGQN